MSYSRKSIIFSTALAASLALGTAALAQSDENGASQSRIKTADEYHGQMGPHDGFQQKKLTKEERKEKRSEHFDMADTDGDDALTFEEYAAHKEKMKEERKKMRETKKKETFLKHMDSNKDGIVSKEEFTKNGRELKKHKMRVKKIRMEKMEQKEQ